MTEKTFRAPDGHIYSMPPGSEDMTEVHDERWLAGRLAVSRRTVQGWRFKEMGPPYVRMPGGGIRYRPADVELWIDEHTQYPASMS